MYRNSSQPGNRRRSRPFEERALGAYYGFLVVLLVSLIVGVFLNAGKAISKLHRAADHPHSLIGEPEADMNR